MSGPERQRRAVLALGGAQTLAWGSTYYLPAILAVPIATALAVSPSTVFGAFSIGLLTTAVLVPLAGRCVDLFGGRVVLALSNVVLALGLVLLGWAQGVYTLFAAWVVIGVGMSFGLYETAFSALAKLYGRQARSAITGVALFAGFASTICWPTSAWLNDAYGWRVACFAWAFAHLAIGIPLNLLVPRSAPTPELGTCEEQGTNAQRAIGSLRGRTMYLLAFVFAASWFTSTALAAHLPRILLDAGATPEAAVAAAALIGPAQVAGRLLDFTFLRHFHVLISARLAALAHPFGAVAFMSAGIPAAALFAGLHGAGNGVLTIAKGTLPLALFGPKNYGLRQGILMVPARFAQAGAPLAFAILIDRMGIAAISVTAALGLAGFVALTAIKGSPEARTS